MKTLCIQGSGWEWVIVLMLVVAIIIPIILFIIGYFTYLKNRKNGKIILIVATIYSIVSLGVCGSAMI